MDAAGPSQETPFNPSVSVEAGSQAFFCPRAVRTPASVLLVGSTILSYGDGTQSACACCCRGRFH